jgi:hypothetical protein
MSFQLIAIKRLRRNASSYNIFGLRVGDFVDGLGAVGFNMNEINFTVTNICKNSITISHMQ